MSQQVRAVSVKQGETVMVMAIGRGFYGLVGPDNFDDVVKIQEDTIVRVELDESNAFEWGINERYAVGRFHLDLTKPEIDRAGVILDVIPDRHISLSEFVLSTEMIILSLVQPSGAQLRPHANLIELSSA